VNPNGHEHAPPIEPVIDTDLVRRLIAGQFPEWADLPVRPVELQGVDNRTFRLGTRLTVRLPSAEGYRPQAAKEQRWLPVLAPRLPLAIPAPVAAGRPAEGYPFGWSVCRWIEGENAGVDRIDELTGFAVTLAEFLVALYRIDATGGPAAGKQSFFRGCPLRTYDAETRSAIAELGDRIPGAAATAVWDAALESTWDREPVWFHGDVAPGNLIVRDGKLAAVIDFGCSGIGDPACDLTIAWTLLSGDSRRAFRDTVAVDAGTWSRGRGWALWKAVTTYRHHLETDPAEAAQARHVLERILADVES
jgi:aminoglycoside phosphotransferase (APT) family kinase protein